MIVNAVGTVPSVNQIYIDIDGNIPFSDFNTSVSFFLNGFGQANNQFYLTDAEGGSSTGTMSIDHLSITSSSVDPVPAPIVGAGLPGLVMLLGGWCWRRRKQLAG
jgi:hypothetical protein